ncbi:MAG: TlpA family protein disulfide reductase [Lewinellaceae bacterium]|nr:TlpA family protein disulfide reductase [Lewinella sp.]MCB9278284.1 TlpA family protein disulfide reductase [Lewinellaceae bacterium]
MKKLYPILILLAVPFLAWQCSNTGASSGLVIQGSINDAANTQAFLDHVVIGKASDIIAKTDIDGSGNFKMDFPEGIEPGIYNLRIGARRLSIVLNGEEKNIKLTGSLNEMANYNLQISGARDAVVLSNTMKALINRQMNVEGVKQFIDTTANPVLAAFIAYQALRDNGAYIDLHKNAYNRLAQTYPTLELTQEFGNFVDQVENQYKSTMATQLIQVGQDAPDIKLASPSGKQIPLSSLKGQVVLIDFWASWCGPCRRENPNVVKVYDKYKDKGFTIYSVSLDRAKEPWVAAIEKDNLKWENHVSDLKWWNSDAAALYGVHSIPNTFLVGRDGKIAAIGLRGAEQIEAALQTAL